MNSHQPRSARRYLKPALAWLALVIVLMWAGCGTARRSLLFHPTHGTHTAGLTPWQENDALIGYAQLTDNPETVWLFLHGNAGQAADRIYALSAFSPKDSVYIMEYPGYGQRPGAPDPKSINAAAEEAYLALRKAHPGKPVCVAGESIGSGPACWLARQPIPPDKLVLVVPFDELNSVAADHASFLPVGLILGETWNNVEALASYRGPLEIFGAEKDGVIPVKHAEALAASRPQARFHLLPGGHNNWSHQPEVRIRNP